MRNRHGDFVWYELMTNDLDGAQQFYSAILGWTVADSGTPRMDYRLASADKAQIAGLMRLPQEAADAGGRPSWVGYIAVDDVDMSIERIVSAGGTLLLPATEILSLGRIAMLADLDGIPFYIMCGFADDLSTAYAENALGHCAWNELAAQDMQGAMRFYSEQFGWTMGFEMDMGDMGAYRFIERDGKGFGGINQAGERSAPPQWSFYFRVADIDAAVEQVSNRGGEIVQGPVEVPGGDYAVNGIDPQGVAFALVGKRVEGGSLL